MKYTKTDLELLVDIRQAVGKLVKRHPFIENSATEIITEVETLEEFIKEMVKLKVNGTDKQPPNPERKD